MIANVTFGSFRLRAEWGGYCPFIRQRTNALHHHDFGEICLVTAGSGRYRHGAEAFPVAAGDIFAAFPGVPHEISSYETGDLELYFLRFVVTRLEIATGEAVRGSHRLSIEERILEGFNGTRLRATNGDSLWPFISLIMSLDQSSPSSMLAKAGESALLNLTLAMMERLGPTSKMVADPAEPTLWERARSVIESQVESTIDTESLAEKLGVCSRTLRRAAHRETGRGIAAEINQIRMMHASHRLLMGFSVAEVSTQFHFSEPAVFTRCFRRVVGTSPSDFKRNYQLGNHAVSPRNDNQKLNRR
jgi:AraC-like DNA-binding protein